MYLRECVGDMILQQGLIGSMLTAQMVECDDEL